MPMKYSCLVDGHGGREVARFVENWIPKEAPRIVDPNELTEGMIRLYNRYVGTVCNCR